jgi:hypothetical protein
MGPGVEGQAGRKVVGDADGEAVGCGSVGDADGDADGEAEGDTDGERDGEADGEAEGEAEGAVGLALGDAEGEAEEQFSLKKSSQLPHPRGVPDFVSV